ncbi:MAG: tetratricopeptide repeat protein [Acidobacteriia bacterium]|nr:tetratricopeptide repeat protein [Terriglobia bacterium]
MTRSARVPDAAASTRALAALLLVGATILAFAPVLSAGFLIYDDERYVLRNPHIQEGFTADALRWAMSAGYASNWHPLTWLSHMLDWRLFGSSAGGHHLTSLLLHAANAAALFLLLDRMTGATGRSAFAAALFALHPLHVESVAWVAERKDVLSTLFWILATFSYVAWTRRGGIARYVQVAALLALGLSAKPMLVTLPLTLLILDGWPLGRFASGSGRAARLVAEKVPLLALSAVSAAVTLAVQAASPAVGSIQEFPLGARVGNALVAYAAYLGKAIWPTGLAVFYPHPGPSLALAKPAAAALLLAAVTALALAFRRTRPYLLAGWLWYLVTLVPVIGLVQVGEQAMADRYTYVPLIGPFIAIAWGVPDAARALLAAIRRGGAKGTETGRPLRWALLTGAGAVLLVLALLTRAQAATWKNSLTLFEHALAVTRGNHLAHLDLGAALAREGRSDEALAHYTEAVRLKPDDATAQYDLGAALAARGGDAKAMEHYAKALALDPGYAAPHNNLGILLAKQGRIDEAARHYAEAVRLRPDFAEAHFNLAVALHALGRDEEAWEEVEASTRLGIKPPEAFLKGLAGKRGGSPASR